MATLHRAAPATAERAERRFFFIMALLMASTVVAGFSVNLTMGRSTFAVPLVFHVHAIVFMSWLALYVAQNGLIAADNVRLHRRVGTIAFGLVPLMVVMGATIVVVALRRSGGPFFFNQNEFLISNPCGLLCFAALVVAALRQRRYTGWHRRLMLCAMAILTGPGLGRLLPMPLLMPNAWAVVFAGTLVFPAIAMAADFRRYGRIHPAYFWGTGISAATFIGSMLLAHSPLGIAFTAAVIEETPGAARPMAAFLPPGFKM